LEYYHRKLKEKNLLPHAILKLLLFTDVLPEKETGKSVLLICEATQKLSVVCNLLSISILYYAK
jgi:hypothetical protein